MSVLSNSLYEAKFATHGVKFELDENVKLDSMRTQPTAQVRSGSEVAPKAQVDLYAIQMEAGETFPPITLWHNIVIDGNTRIAAARKARIDSLPAYRIECRNQEHAKDVAAAINNTNGRRLSPEESRSAAISMMDRGQADTFVARELGMEPSRVRRWRKVDDTRKHAERLEISTGLDAISDTNQARIAEVAHDAPFQALVEVMNERVVPTKEFAETLDEVKKASSDAVAVSGLRERAESWEPRAGLPANRVSHAVTARNAYRGIGALVNHPVDYWVDMTVADEALPKWESVLDLAAAVVAEYKLHAEAAA